MRTLIGYQNGFSNINQKHKDIRECLWNHAVFCLVISIPSFTWSNIAKDGGGGNDDVDAIMMTMIIHMWLHAYSAKMKENNLICENQEIIT
jgi:hypothetical protein